MGIDCLQSQPDSHKPSSPHLASQTLIDEPGVQAIGRVEPQLQATLDNAIEDGMDVMHCID